MLAGMGKAATVLLVMSLSACATLKSALNFQKPDIELQEINVTGLGLQGGTMDLVFDVYNPNDYRLRSTRLEVALELAGTDFGEALIDKPLDLSQTKQSSVIMPVRFKRTGVGAAARSQLDYQRMTCGVSGGVHLETLS